MGEIRNDQNVEQTKADQHQNYGSQQQGRHNREGASVTEGNPSDEDITNPSMEYQNRMNRQDLDDPEKEEDSFDDEMDDEQFEQGRFSTRSQLNEMQDENMVATVEGDDKDILGETENSRRIQQKRRETEYRQDDSQNR